MVRTKPTLAAMAAIAFVLVLSVWFGSGCSPSDKVRPATTARWEKQLGLGLAHKTSAKAGRRIAESGARCLKDRLSTDFLKQEIARLEGERNSTPIDGTWNGKSLSAMPAAQAVYLKDNINWLSKDASQYAACSDIACILGQVYGAGGTEQALKIYGFYLRTGYSISERDYVPSASGKIATPGEVKFPDYVPMSEYLFTPEQLQSFWKLSHLIPEGLRNMTALQRFHHVPRRDYELEDGKISLLDPEKWHADTCGDSFGLRDGGYIRLRRCLEEDNSSVSYPDDESAHPGLAGQFYVVVTHEMSHSFDRMALKGGDETKASETEKWKAFSGWSDDLVRVTPAQYAKVFPGLGCEKTPLPKSCDCKPDPDTGLCSFHQWSVDPKKEGFVRAYAGSSPLEDFAETSAWVRFRPELAIKRSPNKAAYLSDLIYGGRTFDTAGLSKYYEDQAALALAPQLLEIVSGCVIDGKVGGVSSAAVARGPHLTLDRPLPQSVITCLENALNDRINASFEQLRAVEWEACDHFDAHETEIRTRLYSRFNSDLSRLVTDNVDRAPQIRAMTELRAALAAQVDAREGYIHCSRQAQPETCYQNALSDAFDRVAQSYVTILGDNISQEKATFIAQNPFIQTGALVNRFYSQLFAGVNARTAASADARWKSCLAAAGSPAAGDSAEKLLVQPFTGGSHYVASSILNCVNLAVYDDLKSVRDGHMGRFGLSVTDPDVQALIQDILLPAYLDALRSREDASAAAEDQDRGQREPGVLDVLGSSLAGDLAWLGEASTPDTALAACQPASEALFDIYFGRVSVSEQIPVKFAALIDIRAGWSHDACVQAIATPKIAQLISGRNALAWAASMKILDTLVAARARDTATDCIARNKATWRPAALAPQRAQCLTAVSTWNMIEKQALVDWQQAAESRPYKNRQKEVQGYLNDRRRVLQKDAVAAMEVRALKR